MGYIFGLCFNESTLGEKWKGRCFALFVPEENTMPRIIVLLWSTYVRYLKYSALKWKCLHFTTDSKWVDVSAFKPIVDFHLSRADRIAVFELETGSVKVCIMLEINTLFDFAVNATNKISFGLHVGDFRRVAQLAEARVEAKRKLRYIWVMMKSGVVERIASWMLMF